MDKEIKTRVVYEIGKEQDAIHFEIYDNNNKYWKPETSYPVWNLGSKAEALQSIFAKLYEYQNISSNMEFVYEDSRKKDNK